VRFFADPNDANFLENLIAVCKKCHRKEHDEIRKNLPLFNEMLRSWRMR
jgi:5-methylcytosine-specific restriction endonuclease McrA